MPNIRLEYRHRTLLEELNRINMISHSAGSGAGAGSVLPTTEAVAARAMHVAPGSAKHSV